MKVPCVAGPWAVTKRLGLRRSFFTSNRHLSEKHVAHDSLRELCAEGDKHNTVGAQTIDKVSRIGSSKSRFVDGIDP